MSKPKEPHELWDKLLDDALAEEGQRVANLSDAELDASLRKAGLDPAAVRARGAEIGKSLRPRRLLWGWAPALAAAGAVVALTVGVPWLVALLRHPPEDHADAAAPDAATPRPRDAGPTVPSAAPPLTSPPPYEPGHKPR